MVKLGANVLTEILSLIFTRKEEIKGKSLKGGNLVKAFLKEEMVYIRPDSRIGLEIDRLFMKKLFPGQQKKLQYILGHSTLKMTMDLYCYVTEDTLFSEMNKMEQKRSLIEKWFKSGVVEQIHCI